MKGIRIIRLLSKMFQFVDYDGLLVLNQTFSQLFGSPSITAGCHRRCSSKTLSAQDDFSLHPCIETFHYVYLLISL